MTTITKTRIQSIDILRGIAMVVMALDHVRDYFHIYAWTDDPLNLETTTPALYFTRYITHFCAPTFVFLSLGVPDHNFSIHDCRVAVYDRC